MITQVCELYVDDDANEAKVNVMYQRDLAGNETYNNPTWHLLDYLASQGVEMRPDPFVPLENTLKDASDKEPGVNNDVNVVQVEHATAQAPVSDTQPAQVEPAVSAAPSQAQVVVETPAQPQAVAPQSQGNNVEILNI